MTTIRDSVQAAMTAAATKHFPKGSSKGGQFMPGKGSAGGSASSGTRSEVVAKLRSSGYTGPVSYSMTKLREISDAHHAKSAPAGFTPGKGRAELTAARKVDAKIGERTRATPYGVGSKTTTKTGVKPGAKKTGGATFAPDPGQNGANPLKVTLPDGSTGSIYTSSSGFRAARVPATALPPKAKAVWDKSPFGTHTAVGYKTDDEARNAFTQAGALAHFRKKAKDEEASSRRYAAAKGVRQQARMQATRTADTWGALSKALEAVS